MSSQKYVILTSEYEQFSGDSTLFPMSDVSAQRFRFTTGTLCQNILQCNKIL